MQILSHWSDSRYCFIYSLNIKLALLCLKIYKKSQTYAYIYIYIYIYMYIYIYIYLGIYINIDTIYSCPRTQFKDNTI